MFILSISNIKNLLLTNKGERLGNPTFGSELLSVIFEQENTDIESRVEETIRSSMSEFLPFINVVPSSEFNLTMSSLT